MTDYIARLKQFLDAKQFASINRDDKKVDFIDARFIARHSIALEMWRKWLQLLYQNSAPLANSKYTQLDIPYIYCLQKRKYVARLRTLVVLLKNVPGISD